MSTKKEQRQTRRVITEAASSLAENYSTALSAAIARAEKAEASNAELRKALEPFGKSARTWELWGANVRVGTFEMGASEEAEFTVSDLRAAARALEGGRP
jgi:hypothetical protein